MKDVILMVGLPVLLVMVIFHYFLPAQTHQPPLPKETVITFHREGDVLHVDAGVVNRPAPASWREGIRQWVHPCDYQPPWVRIVGEIPGIRGISIFDTRKSDEENRRYKQIRKAEWASWDDIEPQLLPLLRERGCD